MQHIRTNLNSKKIKFSHTKLFLLACLLFSVGSLMAQSNSIEDIKKAYLQSTKAIIENNEVKGYYTFYFLDKANKKENLYMLNIMDNNMQTVYSVEIKKEKNFILLESSFNGKAFCFSFIHYNKKIVEYMILDEKGETAGTYTTPKLSNSELQYMASLVASEDDVYSGGMIAVPNQGFVRYGMEKGDGWRYVMEMIDNEGKKVWDSNSGDDNKKAYETISPLYSNNDVVVSMVNTREKMLSNKTKVYCQFVDIKTGDQLFKTEPTSEEGYLYQPIGVTYDESASEYFVYGEYFKKDAKIAKDKSLGFYFQSIGSTGTIKKETFASWDKEISKVVKVNAKGKMEDNMSFVIHTMVRTADGRTFAIGEQFKKAISGGAVAMNMLVGAAGGSSDVSNIKIELHDMVIFQFNKNMEIESAEVFEKAKTNIALPKGYEFLSNPMLGFMMKTYGWFDYNFTAVSGDKKSFNCAYTNYDKSGKEEKTNSNYIIGNISYTDGKLSQDKIRLKVKPTSFAVMPAKPGYVAIFEYHKKKKTIELYLEKVNN